MRTLLGLILGISCFMLFAQPAVAGCYDCSGSICEDVDPGDSGFENCLSYQICTNGCKNVCTTEGEPQCTAPEGPCACPDERVMITPNGKTLEWMNLPALRQTVTVSHPRT